MQSGGGTKTGANAFGINPGGINDLNVERVEIRLDGGLHLAEPRAPQVRLIQLPPHWPITTPHPLSHDLADNC